jgi:hypothetical protein
MAEEPRRFGPVKTVVFSLLPVLVLLGLLEGGARLRELWYPPMDVDLGQGFTGDSLLFSLDPADHDYRITHPKKTIAFVDQRFATKKAPGTLRIAALGGSSVNYLDYEFTQWPERLKQALPGVDRVEIINCGGKSYGSHRLVLIAAEVLQYDIDLMMFYEAHNEFEELEQLDVANVALVPVQRRLEVSALYRLLRDIATQLQVRQLEKETGQSASSLAAMAPDTLAAWRHTFTPEEIATRMQTYRDNLHRIAELCREKQVPLVIGTVPSNLWKMPPASSITRWDEVQALYDAGNYPEGMALAESLLRDAVRHQSSEAENEIIRDLAGQPGVYLADVKAAVIAKEPHGVPGETLFGDHCHLNPDGNRILVETFQPRLVEALGARTQP